MRRVDMTPDEIRNGSLSASWISRRVTRPMRSIQEAEERIWGATRTGSRDVTWAGRRGHEPGTPFGSTIVVYQPAIVKGGHFLLAHARTAALHFRRAFPETAPRVVRCSRRLHPSLAGRASRRRPRRARQRHARLHGAARADHFRTTAARRAHRRARRRRQDGLEPHPDSQRTAPPAAGRARRVGRARRRPAADRHAAHARRRTRSLPDRRASRGTGGERSRVAAD